MARRRPWESEVSVDYELQMQRRRQSLRKCRELLQVREVADLVRLSRQLTSPWGDKPKVRSDILKAITEFDFDLLSQSSLSDLVRVCDMALESYSNCGNSYLKMWKHWKEKITGRLDPLTPIHVYYAVFPIEHALKVMEKSGAISNTTRVDIECEGSGHRLWNNVMLGLSANLGFHVQRVYKYRKVVDYSHIKINLKDRTVPAHMVIKHDVREEFRRLKKWRPKRSM